MVNLLFFSVEGIRCAIPIDHVLSVSRMVMLTDKVTDGVRAGTINFHGTAIPVYSMRRIFGFPKRPSRINDILIIASAGEGNVALWVDGALSVYEADEIRPSEEESIQGSYITVDGRIVIDDLDLFLGSGEFDRLQEKVAQISPFTEAVAEDAGPSLPVREIGPEKVGKILAERAGQLAGPTVEVEEGAPIEILTFRLMYQEYAIEMDYIREVMIHDEITPVPGTPDYIAGICAVRGEIISLVDLRVLFDLPEKGLTDLNRVIVLTDGELTFGILADYITDIGTITPEQVDSGVTGKTPAMSKYLTGTLGDSIIMLDASRILSDPAMVVDGM